MADSTCPHCGAKLWVRDAFCNTCHQPLDEPPETPRTEAEKNAYRLAMEADAKQQVLGLMRWWRRLFGGLD